MSFRLGRQMPLWIAAAVTLAAVTPSSSHAATSILFDATKAETAANADWVVDADTYNLGPNANGVMVVGGGNEANPQFTPTPAQSGITSTTSETYWKGALSSWGVDAAQRGFTVNTLPNGNAITYGTASSMDLKNAKVFVVDEPNILFTASEKTALLSFVSNGGGLMIISDHGSSDRNNDGNDSTDVWNDLFTNNGSVTNPFGIKFNGDTVSPTNSSADGSANDPITHGKAGTVTSLTYSSGSTITIDTSRNASVAGAVWTTSSHSSTNVMAAYATYGLGRVVAVGDSSPADDGTGDTGDTLFDGWSADKNIFENATLWLSGSTTASAPVAPEPTTLATLVLGAALARRRRHTV